MLMVVRDLKRICAGTMSAAAIAAAMAVSPLGAQTGDPRVGLSAGWLDAGSAGRHMEVVSSVAKPEGFFNTAAIGDLNLANSDLAFRGNLVFVGNFNGFNVYDVSDPSNPRLEVSVICPGGQGDLSVRGNLLFMSVEQTRGRVDCGVGGVQAPASPERFLGVRIFDISDLRNPRQVAAVQTCRGSHTHTLVSSPSDPANLYVIVAGSSGVRPAAELEGCVGPSADVDPETTALFRIEVIEVPLAAPQNARVVSEPRVFADRETGAVAGLWAGGAHGEGTQSSARTDHCHDVTAYPQIGLAAGACSGNGILLDIRDPVRPVRIDEVIDANFAYWHSATFNNDGTTVIFTDEWGGGTSPRCLETDQKEWGANALFRVSEGRMEFAGYYKLPAPQTATENCVAHNGSLVPVPGRDIKVQAWYQGGVSVFDFTDPANPFEIAFFDRGPLSATQLQVGGYWSTYWYNGLVYGSEIARGLDVLRLTPSEFLTADEIEAASLIRMDEFNPQEQPRFEWPVHPAVARALLQQLERSGVVTAERRASLFAGIEGRDAGALTAAATDLEGRAAGAASADARRLRMLGQQLRALAGDADDR